MIKATELRKGNLVLAKNAISGIEEITVVEDIIGERGINWMYIEDMSGPEYSFSEINPIPLTPEILEKLNMRKERVAGFSETDGQWWLLNGARFLFEYDKEAEIYYNGIFGIKVIFVHQLQNLYFALTGEELTIKELAK